MFKNIEDVKNAMKNGQISGKQYWALNQYFDAVEEAAEDVLVIHEYFWDEDDNANLVDMSTNTVISKKDLFLNYSEKDLHGFTELTANDVIDCSGHVLTIEEIREIFWNWGN